MYNQIKKWTFLGVSALLTVAPVTDNLWSTESQLIASRSFSNWKKMYSSSGKCSILFPEDPEHLQQTMVLPDDEAELKYDVYVAGFDQKAVYMVLIAEYPMAVNETYAELSLESFLNGILTQNPHNKLIFADLITVQGHKALDFFIRTKDVYFKGRAIMANNQLYLLAMECEVQNYQEGEFNYFIDSFKFTN